MPTLHIPPSLDLHYLVDDYTDPWRTPGTILLLHGNAESSAAWYAWAPQLAHRYRVVRFHLVGAKIGGTIARAFAARRPARVRTLTVVGTPSPYRMGAAERAPT